MRWKQRMCDIKDLAVTGTDLINLGIAPGKELGTLLNELLDMVIEDPAWNQKGKLCDYVKKIWLLAYLLTGIHRLERVMNPPCFRRGKVQGQV